MYEEYVFSMARLVHEKLHIDNRNLGMEPLLAPQLIAFISRYDLHDLPIFLRDRVFALTARNIFYINIMRYQRFRWTSHLPMWYSGGRAAAWKRESLRLRRNAA